MSAEHVLNWLARRARRGTITTAMVAAAAAPLSLSAQVPRVAAVEESKLREYDGAYEWPDGVFVYVQLWSELTGKNQLVAVTESGDVRALFPTGPDRFFAGPAAGVSNPVESEVEFERDSTGRIASVTWRRSGATRVARRVETERREDVQFANGAIRLAGTLRRPNSTARVPAVILVHGSGAEDREYVLPLARFLIRRGVAVFGYDKRGVGASTGDWRTASYDDLAGDVVAAHEYLRSRNDVDPTRIGLLGWSQAGWIMPLAATRAKDIAFLISVSGAGVSPSETTIDQARHEMSAGGMKPDVVAQITSLMAAQYRFARTGEAWNDYAAARQALMARLGRAPDSFPGSPDDAYWQVIRRQFVYDPVPALRRLTVPTLALFGELDNNIMAEKNKAAWASLLSQAGNTDYTLLILPKANHLMLEAKVGSNAEMPSLRQFVREYSSTVLDWLGRRTAIRTP